MKIASHYIAKKILFHKLALIKYGYIEIIDNKKTYSFGDKNSNDFSSTIHIINPQFYSRIIKNGSVGAAEAFMLNECQVSDLTKLIQIFIQNHATLSTIDGKTAKIKMYINRIKHWTNKNTLQGSKRNIIKHYDLGNDLFSLFLDSKMMYSSAIYPSEKSTLEEAAEYKLKVICDKLQLKPEEYVLEIGTGWGGFAIYAAKHYGCRITTTTISNEQYALANKNIHFAGLSNSIHLLKQDYRELSGQFDKIVAIEMLEAVGHQYLPIYFRKLTSLLKPEGRALIQVISITDQHYERAKYEADFIKQYIFPGGFLPSLTVIANTVTKYTDLRIIDVEDIGLHYAKTLTDWLENFNRALNEILALGYDEIFIRMWQYYLCYCKAAFLEQYISDLQILLIKSKGIKTR